MASLSTVYGLTIVLGSLAAMAAAYVGKYVYTPPEPSITPLASATPQPEPAPLPQPVSVPESTVQTLPATA